MPLKDLAGLKKIVPSQKKDDPTPEQRADRDMFLAAMRRMAVAPGPRKASADDAGLFMREMARTGVKPLEKDGRLAPRTAKRPAPAPRALVEKMNSQAISGGIDDRIGEGDNATYFRSGTSPDLAGKLRRGAWPIADRLDLHGLRVAEAKNALASFLKTSRDVGLKCVIVVHGRGLNSPEGPVLKDLVRAWVRQMPFVMAYVEAGPSHGGEGAIIVLLESAARRF